MIDIETTHAPTGSPEPEWLIGVSRGIAEAQDSPAARTRLLEIATEKVAPWCALVRSEDGGRVRFVAYSSPVVAEVAHAARSTREGLCWEMARDRAVAMADDLVTDGRWPEYGRRLGDRVPIRAGLAVPMHLDEQTFGGLVLYADRAGYFDAERVRLATLLAGASELALALVRHRERAANLELALRSNQTIGMAVGIIMDRRRVTEQQALQTLSDASQSTHIKLREIAARVVESGELPHVHHERVS